MLISTEYSTIESVYTTLGEIGSAGSAAHVDGVIQVVRRVQIEELSKAIDALKESWSDLDDSSVTGV